MAIAEILSGFSGLFSSNIFLTGAGIVVGAIVIGAGAWALHNRRAEEGTLSASWLTRREGLGRYRTYQEQIDELLRRNQKLEKGIEAREKAEEPQATGDKGAQKAIQAVEEGAQAASFEEAVERFTAALGARTVEMVAELKKMTKALIDYSQRKRKNILGQEYQERTIEEIWSRIERLVDEKVIDQQLLEYLKSYWPVFVAGFKSDVELEQEKANIMAGLVNELRKALDVMKTTISGARTDLNKIRNRERKVKRHYGRELIKFQKALKLKARELRRLNRGKEADPRLIVAMMQEQARREQRLKEANFLFRQLQATYTFMKREIKAMRTLLRYIIANERDMAGYERMIEDRKKQLEERFRQLQQAFGDIQSTEAHLSRENPYAVVLNLSGHLRTYFRIYNEIVEGDLSFDSVVKEVTVKNFVMAKQVEALEQLEAALTKSEAAVDSGVQAMTELLATLTGESSKRNIDEVVAALKDSTKLLGYEASIQNFMTSLLRAFERRSRQVAADLQSVIEEDKKLLAQIKAEEESISSHLVDVVATGFKQKVQIDQKYWQPAVEFGQQLQAMNAQAAQRFSRVMRMEALTPAT